ncbi:MAG: hydrogenase 4 subunit D [Firmicutes bacterium]|nr:hydrogenase 4 subunit D [Bacillota bacterium]
MFGYALGSIGLPMVGSLLAALLPGEQARKVSQVFSFLGFLCGLMLLVTFAANPGTYTWELATVGDLTYYGIIVDSLSVLVNFLVVTIGWLVCTYSLGYMTPENREHPIEEGLPRFFALLLLFIGAMAGLVFSSTLFGLLFFFEITGLCSWGLIGFYGTPKSRRSALRAIVLTHIAALGLYVATAYLYANTGSLDVTALSDLTETGKVVAFLGILIACWGKSAQLPFQSWLPGAMVAPTPVSAYLHAASMVKVGVYILARTVQATQGIPPVIGLVGAILATATMVYGFLMYFPQDDMKRLLAYSTIAQLAYIFLAVSIAVFGSEKAFAGAVTHIFNHSFGKALFFLVAGALSYTTGTRQLSRLQGILRQMPLVGLGFLAAALTITGVPLFSGFFSKFLILLGGLEAGRTNLVLLALTIVFLLESVGSFIWLLKVTGASVLGAPSEAVAAAAPLPRSMGFALGCLMAMTLVSQYIAFSLIR